MPDRKPTLSDIDKAPETLPIALAPAQPPAEFAELQSRFTELADENFDLRNENNALKGRLDSKTEIDRLLRPMATRTFIFLCCYCLGALGVILLQGFHWHGFNLDASVLQVLIGSTAVSAIGLVGLVIKGMFEVLKR